MKSRGALSNVHIVTIAVGNLEGFSRPIDSEDIAVHVNQLAPGRFNWRKYPEFIDIQTVNQALEDARRARNGALVTGTSAKGWMLTGPGMEWFKGLNAAELGSTHQNMRLRRGSLLLAQKQEVERMLSSRAYELYHENEGQLITRRDFFDFAKINEYFTQKARRRRFDMVDSTVSDRAQLRDLWLSMKERFSKEFE